MTQTTVLKETALAIALIIAFVLPLGADAASRVDARFQAGLVRQTAAPTEGESAPTEGTNGGQTGEGGTQGTNSDTEEQIDPEAEAQKQLDGFIGDATEDSDVSDIADLRGSLSGGGDMSGILDTIMKRFRSN